MKNFFSIPSKEILPNILAGLTVSFVALSLGAALGILSERGAFIGMLSAGIAVIITASLGGTRVKCSGPTAPLTVVTVMVVSFAHDALIEKIPGANPDHFVNIVLFMSAGILFLMALFKLGKYIKFVPNVVVSGFMNGIALLIWIDQLKKVWGSGIANSLIVFASFLLAVSIPSVTNKFLPKYASYISGTLFTLVIMTGVTFLFNLDIPLITLGQTVSSFGDLQALIASQIPQDFSLQIFLLALPFAFQFAVLIYLDTLLTSLILDKMMGEKTKRSQELFAQGLATAAVATIGGLPGAQATIRSVLLIKEKATSRLAGIMVGVFVLIELFMFQDVLSLIPTAVFSGILFKVGLDIFDIQPFVLYKKELLAKNSVLNNFFSNHHDETIFVTNREILIIVLTIILTIVFDLITAVGVSTALFYIIHYFSADNNKMRDLQSDTETEAFKTEG